MKIERAEAFLVGPEEKRYTWSHDLPEQFQSLTILRIYTDEGPEGLAAVWNAASYDYDRFTLESLRHLLPILIGRDPAERERLRFDLRPRVFPQPPGALALIDIALWDFAARQAGQPLYELLGGQRRSIPSYASTPMYEDVGAYMRECEHLASLGFRAIKFHTWCLPDDDLKLAREARRCFPGMTFMLDAENNYRLADAKRVAAVLHELGFAWFEAPLPDHDLAGYRALCAATEIPIVPSGNWVRDLTLFEECLRTRAWTASRADVVILDGITPAVEAMRMSANAGMNCELMSWGYNLASAANLHVMLSSDNCSYYEQPLPYDLFEYGMVDVIRTRSDGTVEAPPGAGLGLEVDWPAMEARTVRKLVCDRSGVR